MNKTDGKEEPMLSMGNLSRLPRLQELTPEAATAFRAFDQAALSTGVIPRKYKELMAVTVALTTQCTYCIELHRRAAQHAGATDEEMAEAILVAAAIRAGGAVTHGMHLLADRKESSALV